MARACYGYRVIDKSVLASNHGHTLMMMAFYGVRSTGDENVSERYNFVVGYWQ